MQLLETVRQSLGLTCDCGQRVEASVLRVINLGSHPELLDSLLADRLNLVRCVACGREFPAATPVFVHDPGRARYVCCYPSAWRSQELELRIQFYQELLDAGGTLPACVRAAAFVFGARAAAQALERAVPPSPWTMGQEEELRLGDLPEELERGEAWVVAPLGQAAGRAGGPETESVRELREEDFEGVEDAGQARSRDEEMLRQWREGGQDHHTYLAEGAVCVLQLCAEPEAFSGRLDVFFQLHRLENFPLIALVLLADHGQGRLRSLVWLFNLDNPADAEQLEALSHRFEVRVRLFDAGYACRCSLVLSPPLEPNVAYALGEARRWLTGIEPGRRNFFLAASKFDASSLARLGAGPKAPDPGAFRDLPTPAVTSLALEILTYWSSRDKAEYLIFVKSFPLARFHAILAAVLGRAAYFGLAMTKKMRRLSVELGLYPSEAALVRAQTGAFAEVALGLKPNDLDPGAQADNWARLGETAALLGVELEPDLARLIEAARLGAPQGPSPAVGAGEDDLRRALAGLDSSAAGAERAGGKNLVKDEGSGV
jgi:hypothetical protein